MDKELEEWQHIHTDRHGHVMLHTVSSDQPKSEVTGRRSYSGMPTVDGPPVKVHRKDAVAEWERVQKEEIVKEVKEDGEDGFVVV